MVVVVVVVVVVEEEEIGNGDALTWNVELTAAK